MKIKKNQNLFQKLRSNFLTGLVLITPIVLTIYLLWGAINFIDDKVVPWLPNKYNPSTYLGKDIPGLGVLTFLIFTTIIGMVTKGFFGRQLIKFWESLVDRTPVFRSIYNAVKNNNSKTIAFEPSTSNLRVLSRNISLNNLQNKIQIIIKLLDILYLQKMSKLKKILKKKLNF